MTNEGRIVDYEEMMDSFKEYCVHSEWPLIVMNGSLTISFSIFSIRRKREILLKNFGPAAMSTMNVSCSQLKSSEFNTPTHRSYSFRVNWMKDGKLLNKLKKDNIDIELFQCEFKGENDNQHTKTVKSRLLLFLQSNPIQIIIALLVLVDAGIVIAEIILEIHSLKNSIEAHEEQMRETLDFLNRTFRLKIAHNDSPNAHDGISFMETVLDNLNENSLNCTPVKKSKKQMYKKDPHLRTKRSGAAYKRPFHNNFNETVSVGSHKVSEKKHKSKTLHVVSETLHYASIIILGLFVVEVGLKICCVGCKFFKAKFEVVDSVVIVTSFVADVIIVNVGSQEISVMIIFLLWRIVRVINGLLMHEKQRDEFRIALQKKARRVSEMKVEQMTIENEMQEKHILALEECSREAGVPEIVIKRCRPKYIQYTKDQTNNPLKSIAAMTTGFMGGLVGAQHSNKDINRFAASYSPCCTPRNRSPQMSKTHRTSSPSWGDLLNSSNTLNHHDSHLNPPNLKHQYSVTWCSSVNSVFEQNDTHSNDYNGKSSDKFVSFYVTEKLNSDTMVNERLENLRSPGKDYTNLRIISPFIEDVSESASSHFSLSSADDSDKDVLYRCSHNGSNSTMLAISDRYLDTIAKTVDYV